MVGAFAHIRSLPAIFFISGRLLLLVTAYTFNALFSSQGVLQVINRGISIIPLGFPLVSITSGLTTNPLGASKRNSSGACSISIFNKISTELGISTSFCIVLFSTGIGIPAGKEVVVFIFFLGNIESQEQ